MLLLILMALIGAAAVFQIYRFETTLTSVRADEKSLAADVAAMRVALADLRAAEAGYVGTGQVPAAWMTRATTLIGDVETLADKRRAAPATPEARSHFDAATAAFDEWKTLDARARGYVNTDRHFEAADLVFTDAVNLKQRITDELEAARAAESQASAQQVALTNKFQLALAGGALALMLIVAMIVSRRPKVPTEVAAPVVAKNEVKSILSLPKTPAPAPVAAPPAPVVAPPSPAFVAPVVQGQSAIANLTEAADLCVDLGRLMDAHEVPALLERAASVLGANGVILWVPDSAGSLRPSLSHGYPEKVISRVGTLPADGDNATSLAFRTLKPQVVSAVPPGVHGAIAVPLIASFGCGGVLAAEVTKPKPGADTLALARMIAAQLAALIGTPNQSSAARVG